MAYPFRSSRRIKRASTSHLVPNVRYPSEASKLREVVMPSPGLCRSRCVPECWQRSPWCLNIRCTCFGCSFHTLFRYCGRVLGLLQLCCELGYLCRTGVRLVTSIIAAAVSRPFRLLLMRAVPSPVLWSFFSHPVSFVGFLRLISSLSTTSSSHNSLQCLVTRSPAPHARASLLGSFF